MQTQILTFGGTPFLVEYVKYDEMPIKHHEQFVMLRKYDIVNEIAIDSEIVFAPVKKYKNSIVFDANTKKFLQTNALCYPVNFRNAEYFSPNVNKLMDGSRLSALYFTENTDKDYYILRDKQGKPQEIYCDEIRIYKPHNRNLFPAVINISNLMNNIHFHYFCETYDKQEIRISKEKIHGNVVYYEYITFHVPSLEYLFSDENTYYYEDLNLMYFDSGYDDDNLVPLSGLILPYTIEHACTKPIECVDCPLYATCDLIEIKNMNVKNYLIHDLISDEYVNSEYNFANTPIVLTLHHYDNKDNILDNYVSSEGILSSSVCFANNNSIKLRAEIGFNYYDESKISIISHFEYPKMYKKYLNVFEKIDSEEEKYVQIQLKLDVDLEKTYYRKTTNGSYEVIEDLNEYLYTQPEKIEMSLHESYYQLNKITDNIDYATFEGYDDESFLDDFNDEFVESLKFKTTGYVIEISKTRNFSGVFYRTSCAAQTIDDFAFSLVNIFENWYEYPSIIYLRTIFVDKYLAKVFYSNVLVLTKEQFKYCINDSNNDYRLNSLIELQQKITSSKSMENDNSNNGIFFIDKINCSVKKHDVTNETNVIGGTLGNKTIIYKTIFYKTQDFQNIKIRSNVTQKIGINLGDFMSRVSAFKLNLDGYQFVETERNENYVIFTIPATKLVSTAGTYDITNENDEYIDSGKYTVI